MRPARLEHEWCNWARKGGTLCIHAVLLDARIRFSRTSHAMSMPIIYRKTVVLLNLEQAFRGSAYRAVLECCHH